MSTEPKHTPADKKSSNSDKGTRPSRRGGSAQQNAKEWAGGSKAAKGPISRTDKQNENSSAKS